MPDPRRFAGALATLAAPLILMTLWGWIRSAPDERGFRLPVVALELARTPAEVQALAGDLGSPRRAHFRADVQFDFLTIAVYGLFYLALSAALAGRSFRLAVWLAALAAPLVAGAALYDLLENFRLLSVLDLPAAAPEMPARLADLAGATFWKWHSLFLAVAVLSACFFGAQRRWHNAVGALFLAAGLLGLSGVAHPSPALEIGFVLLLAGIVAVAVAWFPGFGAPRAASKP
jgi:hypothetical protein